MEHLYQYFLRHIYRFWKELQIVKVTQHIYIKYLLIFIRYKMIINCQVHNFSILLLIYFHHMWKTQNDTIIVKSM